MTPLSLTARVRTVAQRESGIPQTVMLIVESVADGEQVDLVRLLTESEFRGKVLRFTVEESA